MEPFFVYENSGSEPRNGVTDAALQPCVCVADRPCDAGSPALEGYRPPEDAEVVSRLRRAGIPIRGAVGMSEFGFGLRGGSAGRAAAAGAAQAELMLDLTGESRAAAAALGLWGFKAGYGSVSRRGLIGLVPSMEAPGILARNPAVIRKVLQALSGPDGKDYSQPADEEPDFVPRGIVPDTTVIGVVAESLAGLSPDELAAFRSAVEELRRRGFPIRELSLPGYELFPLVHRIAASVEASSSAGRYDSVRYGTRASAGENWNEMFLQTRGEVFGPLIKSLLLQGAYFQFRRFESYRDACRIRSRLLGELRALEDRADFLLLPSPGQAPAAEPDDLDGLYRRFASTLFANVAGLPALYLPGKGGTGGCQLAAPRLQGPRLLELGEYLDNSPKGD